MQKTHKMKSFNALINSRVATIELADLWRPLQKETKYDADARKFIDMANLMDMQLDALLYNYLSG